MLQGGFRECVNVRLIKAAQDHFPFVFDRFGELRKVLKQDVSVDVGYQEVGFGLSLEHITCANFDIDIRVNLVQQEVLLRILHAPFVDVVGEDITRTTFHGHDSQYACTRSCVDDVLPLKVKSGKSPQDEPRRRMAAGAESQARRDDDVVFGRRHICVFHVVNNNQSLLLTFL